MKRAVKVQGCACTSCGQKAVVKTDVGNMCAACQGKYELDMAIFVDLKTQLKQVMENWMGFWGTVMPLEELTGGDFNLAQEILANLEDQMLPKDAA